jgi:transcriptional regulator with XRE-family HTH domain
MTADAYREMSANRRMRMFLDLTLVDVAAETGISPNKLSAAERGQRPLSAAEGCLLRGFLKARLAALRDVEHLERQQLEA